MRSRRHPSRSSRCPTLRPLRAVVHGDTPHACDQHQLSLQRQRPTCATRPSKPSRMAGMRSAPATLPRRRACSSNAFLPIRVARSPRTRRSGKASRCLARVGGRARRGRSFATWRHFPARPGPARRRRCWVGCSWTTAISTVPRLDSRPRRTTLPRVCGRTRRRVSPRSLAAGSVDRPHSLCTSTDPATTPRSPRYALTSRPRTRRGSSTMRTSVSRSWTPSKGCSGRDRGARRIVSSQKRRRPPSRRSSVELLSLHGQSSSSSPLSSPSLSSSSSSSSSTATIEPSSAATLTSLTARPLAPSGRISNE